MDTIDEFYRVELPKLKEYDKVAQQFYKDFTEEFPRKDIMTIPMEHFLYAPQGFGYEDSFCGQLWKTTIAGRGNAYSNMFELYYAKDGMGGITKKLYITYEKIFENDYEGAFYEIKKDIVTVLDAAERLDFNAVETCKLNSQFKNILIAVYYPDKFIPVRVEDTLDGYCKAVGISFAPSMSMAYKNYTLVEWKKNIPEFAKWDTYLLMRFCDWLKRGNKKIDGNELTQNRMVKQAKQISEEIDNLHLEGETKEAVVKVRVNQGEFRERLFHRYNKCSLCGVSESSFLIASHIKPWAVSDSTEKLDIDNGFLMCPNHDKLFDQGYISFSDCGTIMISPHMKDVDRIFMNVHDDMKIEITEKNKKYLAYHRDNIFIC
jgi:hypothetical protein